VFLIWGPLQRKVVKYLRTLSTRGLVALAAVVALLAVGGTAIAMAMGGSGPVPTDKPLPSALHEGLAASKPEGITARIRFTNGLFPNGALLGQAGSALMSGASGRLWMRDDGRGRLELQSNAGDVQVVWKRGEATVYDASSNTVYRIELPARQRQARNTPPSVAGIGAFLAQLTKHADVSAAKPSNVGGRPAYTVQLSPKEPGGLIGSVRLAWDATRGVPLRAAIYARGGTKPVLELRTTNIRYGSVPLSTVAVTPPTGAKVVDLAAPSGPGRGKSEARTTKLPFQVVAPDSLAGLKHTATRVVGHGRHRGALVVYGEGLGAITVLEREAGADSGAAQLKALPTVPLDGVEGHELATPLATILTWDRGGVSYVLAGSVKPSVAESAARSLR
jgi:outer membrane lipoprotein-sorting protein